MTDTTITFDFYDESITLYPVFGYYNNDRLAISFEGDEGHFGTITVNMVSDHLNDGEVMIKHWSENEPLFAALVAQGWLTDTGREVMSGFVSPKVMVPAGGLADALAKWEGWARP